MGVKYIGVKNTPGKGYTIDRLGRNHGGGFPRGGLNPAGGKRREDYTGIVLKKIKDYEKQRWGKDLRYAEDTEFNQSDPGPWHQIKGCRCKELYGAYIKADGTAERDIRGGASEGAEEGRG